MRLTILGATDTSGRDLLTQGLDGHLAAAGLAYPHAALAALEMTTTMAVAWPPGWRSRGHNWASTLEMCGASSYRPSS